MSESTGTVTRCLDAGFIDTANQLQLAMAWKSLATYLENSAANGRFWAARLEEICELVSAAEWLRGTCGIIADISPDATAAYCTKDHGAKIRRAVYLYQNTELVVRPPRSHQQLATSQHEAVGNSSSLRNFLIKLGLPIPHAPSEQPAALQIGDDDHQIEAATWLKIALAIAKWDEVRPQLDSLPATTGESLSDVLAEIEGLRKELSGKIEELKNPRQRFSLGLRGATWALTDHLDNLEGCKRSLGRWHNQLSQATVPTANVHDMKAVIDETTKVVNSLLVQWPPRVLVKLAAGWHSSTDRSSIDILNDWLEVLKNTDQQPGNAEFDKVQKVQRAVQAISKLKRREIGSRCCLAIAMTVWADSLLSSDRVLSDEVRDKLKESCQQILEGTTLTAIVVATTEEPPAYYSEEEDSTRLGLPPLLERIGLIVGYSEKERILRQPQKRVGPPCDRVELALLALERRLTGKWFQELTSEPLIQDCKIVRGQWQTLAKVAALPTTSVDESHAREDTTLSAEQVSLLQRLLLESLALCDTEAAPEANRVLLELEAAGILGTIPASNAVPPGTPLVVLIGRGPLSAEPKICREHLIGLQVRGRFEGGRLGIVSPNDADQLGPIGRFLFEHQRELDALEAWWPSWSQWSQIGQWKLSLVGADRSTHSANNAEELAAGLELLNLFHAGREEAPSATGSVLKNLAQSIAQQIVDFWSVQLVPAPSWDVTGPPQIPDELVVAIDLEEPAGAGAWRVQSFGTVKQPGAMVCHVGRHPPATVLPWVRASFIELWSEPLRDAPALCELRRQVLKWCRDQREEGPSFNLLCRQFRNWLLEDDGRHWLIRLLDWSEIGDPGSSWVALLRDQGWLAFDPGRLRSLIKCGEEWQCDSRLNSAARQRLSALQAVVERECLSQGAGAAATAVCAFLKERPAGAELSWGCRLAEQVELAIRPDWPIWSRPTKNPPGINAKELRECHVCYAPGVFLGDYFVEQFEVQVGGRIIQPLKLARSAGSMSAVMRQLSEGLNSDSAAMDDILSHLQHSLPEARIRGAKEYHDAGIELFRSYEVSRRGQLNQPLDESLRCVLQEEFGCEPFQPASFEEGGGDWMEVNADHRKNQRRAARVTVLQRGLQTIDHAVCLLRAIVDIEAD